MAHPVGLAGLLRPLAILGTDQVGVDVPLTATTVRLWAQALDSLGPAADHTEITRWFSESSGVTLNDT